MKTPYSYFTLILTQTWYIINSKNKGLLAQNKDGDLMQFSDIKPFARYVRLLEVNKNTHYPEFFPLDARLFYTMEGCGKIIVGGKEISLPVGSILYINAGCRYQILSENVVFLAVNFDFTGAHAGSDTIFPPVNTRLLEKDTVPVECIHFSDVPCFDSFCFFEDFHSLQVELLRLEKEYSRRLPFHKQQSSYILASVLTAMARKSETRYSKEDRFNIERIIKYIHANLQNDVDNISIGKEFHFHPNYISAEFKRYTGQTLHQYVLNARILKATALMESGHAHISGIAKECGFSDANYFSRYFKKFMGISPTEYVRSCIK